MQASKKKINSNDEVIYCSHGYMSLRSLAILFFSFFIILIISEVFANKHLFLYDFSERKRIFFGFLALTCIFLLLSNYILPNGALKWPNYSFWKMAMGLNILYLLILVFLLFQDVNVIKSILIYIDPSLVEDTVEINYAGNTCSLFGSSDDLFSNVLSRLDIFVLAHFFGWLVKALIVRNNFVVWFNSLFFEWLEITFRHILPNFHECWWDHLLLDIFGCNLLGIICGNYIINKFDLLKYDWHANYSIDAEENECFFNNDQVNDFNSNKFASGIQNTPKYSNNTTLVFSFNSRILQFIQSKILFLFKFLKIFSTIRGYTSFLIITLVIQLIDLNYFFLKAELSMPISHWIFALRTLIMAICGAAASRELYDSFLKNESIISGKISIQCWLLAVVLIAESFLCWKFRGNLQPETFLPSKFISSVWLFIFFVLIVSYIHLLFRSFRKNYDLRNCRKQKLH